MKPSQTSRRPLFLIAALFILALVPAQDDSEKTAKPMLELPSLPHIRVNTEERYVEMDAVFCLEEGLLELAVCTNGTKEHESVLSTPAKARDAHLMLTLLKAKSGHPPLRFPIDEEKTRWRDIPAQGTLVDVSVVFEDPDEGLVEKPISYFIINHEGEPFDSDSFVFAGSRIVQSNVEGQTAQYLADVSGNFITISTFGDETLCLPTKVSQANSELLWKINPDRVPPLDTKATLRLKPKFPIQEGNDSATAN